MLNDPLKTLIEIDTEDNEYKISALCLECQKEFFKDEEQDEH